MSVDQQASRQAKKRLLRIIFGVGGGTFKFLLYLELILLISFIASFLIILTQKELNPVSFPINTRSKYHYLIENYRVLEKFFNLPVRSEPIQDPEFEINNPFIVDILRFDQWAENLTNNGEKYAVTIENQISDLEAKHNSYPHRFGYIKYLKEELQKKYFHSIASDQELIERFEKEPKFFETLKIKLHVINSYIKARDSNKAFEMFKELFASNEITPFLNTLPRRTVNSFLKQLDENDWFEKFKFLAKNNLYSEFNREKTYVNSSQLVNLFNGEFSYKQKNYDQCRKYLGSVRNEKWQFYKNRIIFKISLREDNFDADNLKDILIALKEDPEVYYEVLKDAGTILLINGELDLAKHMFSKYLNFYQILRGIIFFRSRLLNQFTISHPDPDYWRILWFSAWLKVKENKKSRAIEFFRQGSYSPIQSYRIANQYWYQRFGKNSETLDLDQYPFTYYYTLGKDPEDFRIAPHTLISFIDLLNQNRSISFKYIIEDIEEMVHYNLFEEAAEFIRWVIKQDQLTVSDKHTLMLVESILYLKKKNYALAFIRFRDNFDCYKCIRLPRFLKDIILPVKYRRLISQFCNQYEIDKALIYALIRQESYFRPRAISSANAYGLMQLILPTARQVAYTRGQKVFKRDLFVPKTNIQLGIEYLNYLLEKYNGQKHLALAAYNAGDHRVDKWLQLFGNIDAGEFIEMIPFSETRSYVKNILRNYFYYKVYYGNSL